MMIVENVEDEFRRYLIAHLGLYTRTHCIGEDTVELEIFVLLFPETKGNFYFLQAFLMDVVFVHHSAAYSSKFNHEEDFSERGQKKKEVVKIFNREAGNGRVSYFYPKSSPIFRRELTLGEYFDSFVVKCGEVS